MLAYVLKEDQQIYQEWGKTWDPESKKLNLGHKPKKSPDTIGVKQAWRAAHPERTGAKKAPGRCYKGKDEAHRISSVFECTEKRCIPLIEILGMDT